MLRCCPSCRLLARSGTVCAHCGDKLVEASRLARPRVAGVTALTKEPATGWRDRLALYATAFGVMTGTIAGALLFGGPGALLGPALGVFGYTKQYWRTAFTRRDKVMPVAPADPPADERIVGAAQPHLRTLDGEVPPRTLAFAWTIHLDGGVIARHVETVPFWLMLADQRRLLVDGVAWLASTPTERLSTRETNTRLHVSGITLTRSQRRRITGTRTILVAGDRCSIAGAAIAPEQLVGAGYRDHLVEAMRGLPAQPLWIERLGPEPID